MKINILLSLSICFLMLSCQNPSGSKAKAVPKPVVTGPVLPSVPNDVMKELWEECDYTDFIFHHLPFSMSQDQKQSIQSTLSYVSAEPLGSIVAGCKPDARQFFHIKGEIVREADVYLKDGCYFYVFVENEKPVYANKMAENGVSFFTNTIKQALGSNPQ